MLSTCVVRVPRRVVGPSTCFPLSCYLRGYVCAAWLRPGARSVARAVETGSCVVLHLVFPFHAMGCEDEAVLSQTSDAVFRRGCCSRLVACLPMKAWAELASLLAWLFTGVSFVVTKQSFADASPLVFQALRFSIAFVTLLFLYRREGLRLVAHWRGVLVVGTFLTAGTLSLTQHFFLFFSPCHHAPSCQATASKARRCSAPPRRAPPS